MALLSFPIECMLQDCLAAVVAGCRIRTREQKLFWYKFVQARHRLLLLHLKFFLLFAIKETKEEGITSYQHSNALLGAQVCSRFYWRYMDKHTKTQHIHVTWPWMKKCLYQMKEHTSEKKLICCWSLCYSFLLPHLEALCAVSAVVNGQITPPVCVMEAPLFWCVVIKLTIRVFRVTFHLICLLTE